MAAIAEMQAGWCFHRAQTRLEAICHYGKPGRPKKEAVPQQIGFRVVGQIVEHPSAIEAAQKAKGKFVLATHELAPQQLCAETILVAYKSQGVSVERGFRFLKDPLFFVSGVFLEKPERIMALLMVMGLALLIYALAEHQVRTQLATQGQTLPNQVGKPTQRPTVRRIFQVFEGIDVLWIEHGVHRQRIVLNLKPIHFQILELFGPTVKKYYFPDE